MGTFNKQGLRSVSSFTGTSGNITFTNGVNPGTVIATQTAVPNAEYYIISGILNVGVSVGNLGATNRNAFLGCGIFSTGTAERIAGGGWYGESNSSNNGVNFDGGFISGPLGSAAPTFDNRSVYGGNVGAGGAFGTSIINIGGSNFDRLGVVIFNNVISKNAFQLRLIREGSSTLNYGGRVAWNLQIQAVF